MAPWGPRGCGALVSLLLLLLLLLPQATLDPTCPTPMSVAHADIQVKNYHLHARERYTCKSGFKRKAGTSSLTQCVLNQTTNMAHWTPPNLQCIRDPSLSHQRPPSTVVPTGAGMPSPSGKEPASTSKTGNTAATRPTPPAGTEGWYIHGSSPSLSQTTAKASEHSPSNPTGTASYSTTSRNVTVAITIPVMLAVALLVFLLCYMKRRQRPPVRSTEMESTEAVPMAGDSGREGETSEPEDFPGAPGPVEALEGLQVLEQPAGGAPGWPSR
ncbi:interleukin-15 receptor subunit alpha isoform X5 [Erinaceus europaeus]|uniref:Interleukin-15 receptor subunit alpha n=1 Tax=Erinaceus europaeus TaxID=9365 RepID=A0A1S3WFS4_ERIEU|nr:interleukin-15 receptor subunit alpha isoform X5 [Erinaceus europaeus]